MTLFTKSAIEENEQVSWDIKRWHTEKNEVVLSKQVRFGAPEKEEAVALKP